MPSATPIRYFSTTLAEQPQPRISFPPYSHGDFIPRETRAAMTAASLPKSGIARTASKWAVPAAAAAVVAVGVAAANMGFAGRSEVKVQKEAEERARLARNQALLNSYGDGSTMEDLQRAVDAYERR
ncbi:hypothetical protein M501DRAFT_986961 [Patellaria atrata CBS 101060]|uniref:Uncharacterized protein n=1 Tax=Patellaria atrata CBS 101060 TaxID=1346257 RepID=A0A9P4S6N1_9PEZI|nr:hypothetical protein M501DRAFT_986961 [Patellaria atrata CBS 101060]